MKSLKSKVPQKNSDIMYVYTEITWYRLHEKKLTGMYSSIIYIATNSVYLPRYAEINSEECLLFCVQISLGPGTVQLNRM